MKEWLITHVDALIPLVLGLFVALKLMLKREDATLETVNRNQRVRLGATVLIAIGIMRFFTGSATSRGAERSQLESAQAAGPVTATTDDGMVSAVFPHTPVRTDTVDERQGIQVRRVTRTCKLEGGRINLSLAYSEYPPGGKGTPKEVLLANVTEMLKQQGFDFVGSSEHPGSIVEITLVRPSDDVRMVMRVWPGPEGLYRTLATLEKGHHDDPRASAFMASFRKTKKAGSGE